MRRTTVRVVRVHRSPLDHRRGLVVAGPVRMACALGRAGTTRAKREGDGATPVGRLRLLGARYRADRLPRPRTLLRLQRIRPGDGWCDAPSHRAYNRPVRLPFSASHEVLWRDDAVYDVIVDIAWNRGPILKNRGSAIFLHLRRPAFSPTEGCVAVGRDRIAQLLARMGPHTRIVIG